VWAPQGGDGQKQVLELSTLLTNPPEHLADDACLVEHNLKPRGATAFVLPDEGPGMSAFAIDDGVVYHTYSTYERGIDVLWAMYQWLDRAPRGRNETGLWWRRHDEYGNA
jgi:predicted dithiol-disulfide oxidoreductase (DUF899 family)